MASTRSLNCQNDSSLGVVCASNPFFSNPYVSVIILYLLCHIRFISSTAYVGILFSLRKVFFVIISVSKSPQNTRQNFAGFQRLMTALPVSSCLCACIFSDRIMSNYQVEMLRQAIISEYLFNLIFIKWFLFRTVIKIAHATFCFKNF